MPTKSPTSTDANQSEPSVFQNPQELLMNAPVGIFTSTPGGRYLCVNNTLALMHGYDSPRQLMDTITDIATQIYVDPADRDELKRLLVKYGRVTNFECRLRHRNGTFFWVSENISVIKDEDGNIVGYQGFNQDITERKQAEEALRESEASFKMLAEKCPISIFRFDRQGRVNFVNDWHIANFAFNRLDKDFFLGKSVHELPGLINAGVSYEVSKIFNGETVEIDEVFFPEFAAGGSGWVNIRAVPVYEKGVVAGGILISENTTKLKNTEIALKEKSKLLEAFLDNTPDIMSVKQPDLSIIRCNKAGYKFLQKSPEQVHEKKCYTLLGKKQPCDNCASLEALKLRAPVDREKYVPALQTFFRFRTNLVLSDDGRIKYVVETIQDITEKKQMEEYLLKSKERLTLAMKATKDALWDLDVTTGELYFSPGYYMMLGYEYTEVPQHVDSWLDLIHPEDKERTYKANMDCIENRIDSFAVEFRMRAKDGGWRWMLGRGQAVNRDASGKATRMIGAHTDITERKQTEESLRANEKKYRLLFESSPISLWKQDF